MKWRGKSGHTCHDGGEGTQEQAGREGSVQARGWSVRPVSFRATEKTGWGAGACRVVWGLVAVLSDCFCLFRDVGNGSIS